MTRPDPVRPKRAALPFTAGTSAFALLLAALLACPSAQAALTIDRNAPIQIEADAATIDEPTGSAVYRGRVVLQQGTLKLQSRELVVYIQDGKAVKAVADGTPVLLDQAPTETDEAIHAEARRITFLIAEDRMLLDNQATLRQGDRLFQGAHIDYNVVARRVNASGGGSSRVLLVLPPTPAKDKDAKPAPAGRAQSTLQPAANGRP